MADYKIKNAKITFNPPSVIAKLLRTMADGTTARENGHHVILEAAAAQLDLMGDSCIPLPGEPSFRLLGRDPQAPALVEQWVLERAGLEPDVTVDKLASALAIANGMRAWKIENEVGLRATTPPRPWAVEMGFIDRICSADEGNSITVLGPNPDFNDQPDRAIEVVTWWGPHHYMNYGSRCFAADTMLECLRQAWAAMLAREK